MRIMAKAVNTRERLRARIGVLEGRLAEIERYLREPEESDLEEWASEWDDDSVLDGLAHVTREELERAREALLRLEKGTYGLCQGCGRPIARRRLRALPEAADCVRCAWAAA